MQKEKPIEVSLDPRSILLSPLINKGTAFTKEERDSLGLHGFLPTHISNIEEQVKRRYQNFCDQKLEIARYVFLTALHDRNETLFFRLVQEHIDEMLPYIYTPTVGAASLQFSYLYHQTRGVYFSYSLRDKMDDIVRNIYLDDVDVIVVTDGSRILGLGDLGIGGMAIPIGKLTLYTLFGGIAPDRCLPVMLDVGTNNETLLNDPLYLGLKKKRIVGKEYETFVQQFISAIKKRYPNVLLQWEDFSKPHARLFLDAYRNQICSFNDDIQGTAAVALAGILAALRARNSPLKEQSIAILGGGSAGLGIAEYLLQILINQGLNEQEAKEKIYILDIHGLIYEGLEGVEKGQMRFSQPKEKINKWNVLSPNNVTLLDVMEHAKPTILIGVSAQTGAFTKEIVRKMAAYAERPIIFPLSNPTSKSEATPEDVMHWTNGKAIVATGSPFVPVTYLGKTYQVSQCNNVYIFPGVGLGSVVSKSKIVPDRFFLKAAEILSAHAPILKNSQEGLFPKLQDLREISLEIAAAIVEMACRMGLSQKAIKGDVRTAVKNAMWTAEYRTYTKRIK